MIHIVPIAALLFFCFFLEYRFWKEMNHIRFHLNRIDVLIRDLKNEIDRIKNDI